MGLRGLNLNEFSMGGVYHCPDKTPLFCRQPSSSAQFSQPSRIGDVATVYTRHSPSFSSLGLILEDPEVKIVGHSHLLIQGPARVDFGCWEFDKWELKKFVFFFFLRMLQRILIIPPPLLILHPLSFALLPHLKIHSGEK